MTLGPRCLEKRGWALYTQGHSSCSQAPQDNTRGVSFLSVPLPHLKVLGQL